MIPYHLLITGRKFIHIYLGKLLFTWQWLGVQLPVLAFSGLAADMLQFLEYPKKSFRLHPFQVACTPYFLLFRPGRLKDTGLRLGYQLKS